MFRILKNKIKQQEQQYKLNVKFYYTLNIKNRTVIF